MKSGRMLMLFITLIISLAANFFLFESTKHSVQGAISEKPSPTYSLLSEEIVDPAYDIINNFLPLRQQLHVVTDSYRDSIAVYFKYLPTGTAIGINDHAEFTAASLLKVPVVMAYFYKKERLGLTSDPTVTIQEKHLNDKFGDLYKKGAGTSINLDEAVRLTLQKSDNTASFVLADQIPEEDFMHVYQGLDIDPKTVDNSPIITAEKYGAILKSLFSSSILTKEHSQYILDLLTHTEFDSMLHSGIPNDVPIAHKIGLIDHQIYSDCGIVYVPNRPYIMCVISKSDRVTAKERMHDISKAVYEYVAGYKVN